jgi:dihydroorotase
MLNVMDKFLALGLTLDDVVAKSTWAPAREIKQDGLGNLSVGSVADVAVLRVEQGKFGLVDMNGARMDSTQRLMCELTVKDGRIVYDLNGISRPDWRTLPADYGPIGNGRWDGLNPARGTTPGTQRGRGGETPAATSEAAPRSPGAPPR